MTENTLWSIGTIWLGMAIRPKVAMTAVRPSRSGTPAATSAPNATTRISRVTGSESSSIRCMSLSSLSLIALLALAPPNWPTNTPGFSDCTRWTAATTGSTSFSVVSSSPAILKSTSTERPSCDLWPQGGPALGRLHEDGLLVLLGEVVVDQLVGAAGLPDVVVLGGGLLDAER